MPILRKIEFYQPVKELLMPSSEDTLLSIENGIKKERNQTYLAPLFCCLIDSNPLTQFHMDWTASLGIWIYNLRFLIPYYYRCEHAFAPAALGQSAPDRG